MNYTRINLKKGFIEKYDFGNIKLHAYQTNDLMKDESYILENDKNILLLEFPAFYDNLEEFKEYVYSINKNIIGKIFSDHPNGGTIFTDIKGYASEGTIKSMENRTIKGLVTNFEKAFEGTFAKEFHKITDVLKDDTINIGEFILNITYHEENIEIEFPQINCIYTHMLGHNCHSIVAGKSHAINMVKQLENYKEKGYNLILSSHHTPETLTDVDTKIHYLEDLQNIAQNTNNQKDFKEQMTNKFKNYDGLNYLDMTANFFFPEKNK